MLNDSWSSLRGKYVTRVLCSGQGQVHLVGVIADMSVLLNLVPWPECTREFIERAVHARDGHNASLSGVVEL
jgi:hypothetical protein